MKIRTCFVSNSSSSSFIINTTNTKLVKSKLNNLFHTNKEFNNEETDCVKIYTFTEYLPEETRKKYIHDMEELTYWKFVDGKDDYDEYCKERPYFKDLFPTYEDIEAGCKVENGNTYIVTSENYYNQNQIEEIENEFGIKYNHLG